MSLVNISDPSCLAKISEKYQKNNIFFPLIAAVLSGNQIGQVFSTGSCDNYFIVHKFGFADLLETEQDERFNHYLHQFIESNLFPQQKIRWYKVPEKWVKMLDVRQDNKMALVERAKFTRLSKAFINQDQHADIHFEIISKNNFNHIDAELGLSLGERFWSTRQQFLNHSFGVAAYKNKELAAVCYACAIENEKAEIDVFTKPEFRSQGIGKLVTAEFINMCIARKITPHWDCYTNNISSMQLATSLQFSMSGMYQHIIISK